MRLINIFQRLIMNAKSVVLSNEMWNEFSARLKSFIARRVSNPADAEDLAQDVLCKIYANVHQLSGPAKVHAWLFQIARNAIVDYYRNGDRKLEFHDELPETPAIDEQFDQDAEEEVLSWLAPMTNELPEKYRQALQLADFQGLTQKDLAEKLDISLSGAKSRVQRGREKLREVLIKCCHLEFDHAGRVAEWQSKTGDCLYCQIEKRESPKSKI